MTIFQCQLNVLQINAGTWTTEQLMIATGYRPANGFVNTNANSRSQYPPPSPTEIWIAEHPLPMESTYKAVLGAEPAFTSCHGKFIGTVDYVWFTPQVSPCRLILHRANSKQPLLLAHPVCKPVLLNSLWQGFLPTLTSHGDKSFPFIPVRKVHGA